MGGKVTHSPVRDRDRSETAGPHRADIRRDHVFEDGYTYLSSLGSKLKGRVAIRFIDEYGMHEAGIDGGGVFKEFMTAACCNDMLTLSSLLPRLLKEALDTNCGLFTSTPDQMLYPNPHAYAKEERQLDHFKFLGLVLGKALYEGILVDAVFAPFFLNKWLGRLNYLDDLLSLDKDLYNGLIYLKNYTGDAEDLALNFTTTVSEFGSTKIIELISDGANVPVTNANKIRYIYLVANYRLNVEIDQQCRAFFSGLVQLINPKWLRMFNQLELQVLLSGAQRPIDVEDLRANVVYTSGYDEDHPVIHNFWAVVRAMSDEERRRLVRFVTSVERPPLLGFREMNPLITIQNTGGTGGRPDRLPTSSTCVNLLKLPPYPDQTMMRDKLLYAIYSGAGFDLS
ncbi:MAG: hypothetical protein BJ554DRAFT_4760 [Olpidium bornovanus]|uniref:HECT-type E3 ubiquitin transferase n=1 Tax=Olpidium bornovanus TaxID=278681 RepID=A0A8H8DEU5_9FUNG|nr:MAG: hypothetical protein BJ554DRAFT_4760 [Olpidium bornovanus]